MPWPEFRSGHWTVKYRKPDGKIKRLTFDEKGEHFADEEAAYNAGLYQEELIRRGKWVDPDAPKITFAEWAPTWYSGQDLEPSTMAKIRSVIEGHLLPRWGTRELVSIAAEEMAPWERDIVRAGYAPRTARDARSQLITILNDAVPLHLAFNPALRRRGKGRKGLKRVARHQAKARIWASPLQVILVAERAAILAGNPDVFLMLVTKAFTGLRWSEVLALTPDSLLRRERQLDIQWKLYELSGFYWGIPKDGSIRQLDIPAWLWALLEEQAERARPCSCSKRSEDLPHVDGIEHVEWCVSSGKRRLLFLTPEGAHYQRGNFGTRIMRPAADGMYPGKSGARARPPRPVTVQVGGGTWGEEDIPFPGQPLQPPWPYAAVPREMDWEEWPEPPEEFVIPRQRGQWFYDADDLRTRQIASWAPVMFGLTPHGLRYSLQTWMDDGGIKKALKVDRMGHEDLSMSGLYGQITDQMVTDLLTLLTGLWDSGVAERFKIHPRSPVPILDAAMAPWREGNVEMISVSQIVPKHARGRLA
ncbi:hypothetical protein [Nonomuraea sediminis]|uniref:hypothetical protein n=1 Tax=Nonomuraea sediminis TaxID=2835864 RepID=UPI001BDBB1DE|nr:hypothetical protein [Nonomuraea sediminis]